MPFFVLQKSLDSFKKYSEERLANGKEQSSAAVLFYDTFYTRLWDVAPETADLFHSGIATQGPALFGMVSTAVKLLKDGEVAALGEALKDLAQRHNGYGVKLGHYEIVGRCLCYTISKLFEGIDQKEVSTMIEAWVQVYCFMMLQMIPVVATFYRKHLVKEKTLAKKAAAGTK